MSDQNDGAVMRRLYTRVHLARLGFTQCNNTLLAMEAQGRFPKRIRISSQSVAWLAAEIDAHIEALAAAREKRS